MRKQSPCHEHGDGHCCAVVFRAAATRATSFRASAPQCARHHDRRAVQPGRCDLTSCCTRFAGLCTPNGGPRSIFIDPVDAARPQTTSKRGGASQSVTSGQKRNTSQGHIGTNWHSESKSCSPEKTFQYYSLIICFSICISRFHLRKSI